MCRGCGNADVNAAKLGRHLYVLACRVVQEENLAGDVLPLIPRPEDLVEIARRASHL